MIEGARVALRRMTLDDTVDVVRWRTDPAVIDYLFGDDAPTRASHEQWFEKMMARGDRHEFIIVERDTQRSIGAINLSDMDRRNSRAEYGILIGEPDARSKGFAYAASELILDYAFKELKLHRVYLYVFSDNSAAIKLYAQLGFQIEGTLHQHICKHGTFCDVYVMAILADEWRR